MKTLLLLAFSFTTALAQATHAAPAPDQDEAKPAKKQQQKPPQRQAPAPQAPKVQPKPHVRQAPVYRPPQVNPVQPKQAPQVRSLPDQDAVRRPHRNPDSMPYVRPNPSVVTPPPVTVQPNVNPRRRSDWDNRDRRRSLEIATIGIGTITSGAAGPTTTTVGNTRAGVIIAVTTIAIGGEAVTPGSRSSAPVITSGTTAIGSRPMGTIPPITLTPIPSRSMATMIWNQRR